MWITGTNLAGFSFASPASAEFGGRVTGVVGPAEAQIGLGDALDLFFASFDRERLIRVLCRLGFCEKPEDIELRGEPFPDHVSWKTSDAPRALMAASGDRTVRIDVRVVLDPVQFRRLRDLAIRDHRLVSALSAGSTAELSVGCLFDSTFHGATLDLLRLVIGQEALPVTGAERPSWLDTFLADLAPRFLCLRPGLDTSWAASLWLEAAFSPDPVRQCAAATLGEALSTAPFNLGQARPVLWNGTRATVVAGPRLRPIDALGAAAAEAVVLGAAVFLSGAEILYLPARPGLYATNPNAVLTWLERQVEDDASPLEQLLVAGIDLPAVVDLGTWTDSEKPPGQGGRRLQMEPRRP
jgi:hypothetical protein